jgi:hypothetical protein
MKNLKKLKIIKILSSLLMIIIIIPQTKQQQLEDEEDNIDKEGRMINMRYQTLTNKMNLTPPPTTKTTTTPSTATVPITQFCQSKLDGLYDDSTDCSNFIICYANRTFRTKCAFGTLWNHHRTSCDFPEFVDCSRGPRTTTTTTITTTTLFTTTLFNSTSTSASSTTTTIITIKPEKKYTFPKNSKTLTNSTKRNFITFFF